MTVHPNSLANLKNFAPGYDPRRRVVGRPAGASIREHYNVLCEEKKDGTARYPKAELERIRDDPKSSHPRVIAAIEILEARTMGFNTRGTPYGANSRDRLHDRTVGKPIAAITVTKIVEPNLLEVQNELTALLESHPEWLPMIASGQLLSEPQEEAQEIIDTTATEVSD